MKGPSNEEIRDYIDAGHTQAEAAEYFKLAIRTIRRRLRQLEEQEAEAAELLAIEQQKQAEIDRVEAEVLAAKQLYDDEHAARIASRPAGVSLPRYVVICDDGSEDWQPWIRARRRDLATGRSTLDSWE